MEINTKQILAWMRSNLNEFRDVLTGEINHTELAESAALAFNLYEDNIEYKIPEKVFDLAIDADED